MLREARAVNLSLADHVVARAVADAGENGSVAVLGLAFKGAPETADRRGSVGVAILEKLRTELGAGRVVGWDPGEGHAPAAIGGAGVVILANDHPALASPEVMDACAPAALFYDLCALLPPQARQGRRVIRLGAEGAE
jgi:UDP-N-acetyl-D-mannosaminuronate dehydrogenase